MTALLATMLDRLLGRGDAAVTVPPMDGPLRPNGRLDDAAVLARAAAPDNLVNLGGRLLFSSAGRVCDVSAPDEVAVDFGQPVSSLATWGDDMLVAGLADGGIAVQGGPRAGLRLGAWADGRRGGALTAVLALDADTLIVAEGSRRHGADDWQLDLMARHRAGAVWVVDLASGKGRRIASDLAWPSGLLLARDGRRVLVSESWRHRVIGVPLQDDTAAGAARRGGVEEVLGDLPAYPSRMTRAADGDVWLALFAPRSQLVELVLREPRYRRDMMREIAREHWICPALYGNRTFLEPLQRGALKQMGILKPWAPTRSYGLVVRLDPDFNPLESLHSRADGNRHGITSLVAQGGRVLAASRGGDLILVVHA